MKGDESPERDPVDDGHCVACGHLSEFGLHMVFDREPDGSVISRVTVPARFAGWRDVTHGGTVAMILDEAMAYAAGAAGVLGVTGEMTLRFRAPIPIGVEVTARGKLAWRRRNVLGVEATIESAAGLLLARATGSFLARGTVEPGTRFARMR